MRQNEIPKTVKNMKLEQHMLALAASGDLEAIEWLHEHDEDDDDDERDEDDEETSVED